MQVRFDVFFKKHIGTLFKDNEVDLDGKEANVNIDLNLVDRLEVNYSVGSTNYTDEVIIKDINNKEILIPFKSDVVKKGLNEFEVVAYMKNGDIKVSQTYTYNIEKGIGEGEQVNNSGSSHSHSNLSVLNTITQTKINEWNNKADASHEHSDYASNVHAHNVNEIEGLENIDIDLSNYYTKSEADNFINNKADKGHTHSQYLTEHQDISHKADKENTYTKSQTDNKIVEEIAKAQTGGSGEVDLSAYATKNYVDDEISKIELKEGPQGPQGLKGDNGDVGPQGPQGEQGLKGDNGITPNITIGTVTTLEPNQQATVTRRGTDINPIFDFGIPRGEDGIGGIINGEGNTSSDFTLILDLTTEEEVNKINITKDIDGNSFAYKDIYIICTTSKHASSCGLYYRFDSTEKDGVAQYDYGYSVNSRSNAVGTATHGSQHYLHIFTNSFGFNYYLSDCWTNSVSAKSSSQVSVFTISNPMPLNQDGLIRTVAIWVPSSSDIIPIGSNFKIYGR